LDHPSLYRRVKGDQIPNEHHVAHLCKKKHLLDDLSGRVGAAAFQFRAEDTDGLSCNWLEHVNGVRNLMRLQRRSSNRLAVINCGECRAVVRDAYGIDLSIIEDPLPADSEYANPDPSHALIQPPPEQLRDFIAAILGAQAIAEPAT
jgi:hypothetical protein